MSWCSEHECPDFVCEPFRHHTQDGEATQAAFNKRYEKQPPFVREFLDKLGEQSRKELADDAAFARIDRRLITWATLAYLAFVVAIIYIVSR